LNTTFNQSRSTFYQLDKRCCIFCGNIATLDFMMIEPFEPNILRAALNIFGAAYEYKIQNMAF